MRKKQVLLIMICSLFIITTACASYPSYPKSEGNKKITKNEITKTIVVAGAEPEGIVAAVILAQRGHKVYLLDHHHEPGG